MFGLYMAITYGIARIINRLRDCKDEYDARKDARENGKELWIDRYGCPHHTSNDEPFWIRTDFKTRDKIETNPYTGEIVRNITQDFLKERERKRRQEAIDNRCLLYELESGSEHFKKYNDGSRDARMKHIKTGEIYIPRKVGLEIYFLNVRTGHFEYYDDTYNTHLTKNEIKQKIKMVDDDFEWYRQSFKDNGRTMYGKDALISSKPVVCNIQDW